MSEVYINKISTFLPNSPISNNEMEQYLGLINGKPSKSKSVVLRSNKIEQRYYALNKDGNTTHTNAEMVALAIRNMFGNDSNQIANIELLACGTTSPDALLPSHAVLVHGLLPESANIEVVSNSGACCSGMHAFKYAYLSIKSAEKNNAVCCGSERMSPLMKSTHFEEEVKKLVQLEKNPYIAFEKDFLRWMLSDGAGAFFLENKKNEKDISLKVEWIELCSYANKLDTCMFMGAEKLENGKLKGYQEYSEKEIIEKSVLSIKQDVKLLSEYIVDMGYDKLSEILKTKNFDIKDLDYFLPHISSHFFEDKIYQSLEKYNIPIPQSKWFMNLKSKGNVGAGSIYIMLEELLSSGKLKSGNKILCIVPESARFSYAFCLLTVC